MKKKIFTGALVAGLPTLAMAQTTAFSILAVFENILRILPRLLIALGFIYFLWGVVKYITASDTDAKEAGKKILIQGAGGLLVAVSIWGIIGIVQSTFGLGSGGSLGQDNIPNVLGN